MVPQKQLVEMPFSPLLLVVSQYRNRAGCVWARRTSGKSSQLAREEGLRHAHPGPGARAGTF